MKRIIVELFKNQDNREILTKGFSFLVLRLFGAVVGYIFTIYVSNKYGADVYGLLALCFSIFLIVSVFGLLGLDTNLVRFFSQDKNDSEAGIFYKSIIITFIASSFFAWVVYIFENPIVLEFYQDPKPELLDYLPWILGCIPFWNVAMICSSLLRAKRQSMAYSFINYPSRFLFSILILYLFSSISDDPIFIVKAHFWAVVATTVFGLMLAVRKLNISLKTKIKSVSFIKDSFPMLLSSSILILLSMVDTQIMGVYESKANVGIYTVAVKIAALSTFTLQAINSILAPKIAKSHAEGSQSFGKLIKFSTNLNFIITILIALAIIVFHKTILELFGEEFKSGGIILIILCVGQIVNSFSGSVGIILQMIGKQKVQQNFVIMALLINIVLTFILTPRYGGLGAATATIISIAFWNIGCSIYIKKKLGIKTYFHI